MRRSSRSGHRRRLGNRPLGKDVSLQLERNLLKSHGVLSGGLAATAHCDQDWGTASRRLQSEMPPTPTSMWAQ